MIADCQLPIADCPAAGRPSVGGLFRRVGGGALRSGAFRNRQSAIGNRQFSGAFTLIELLVVVAIMAIVMTISVPFMNNAINSPKGINGAAKAVQEVCKTARDWAILRQQNMTLNIRGDGSFEVNSRGAESAKPSSGFSPGVDGDEWRPQNSTYSPSVNGGEWRMQGHKPSAASTTEGRASFKLPEDIAIEGIWIGGRDVMDYETVTVVFRPNGIADELSVVLYKPETNERRNIILEVVTGLPDIESDPSKFKTR